jgi:hypothetical protein
MAKLIAIHYAHRIVLKAHAAYKYKLMLIASRARVLFYLKT